MHGDGPLPGLVEELLVVPVRMCGLELSRSQVVIAKPQDAERQQERVFVAARIADLCRQPPIVAFSQIRPVSHLRFYRAIFLLLTPMTSIGFLLSVYNLNFFVYFVFRIFLYRAAILAK